MAVTSARRVPGGRAGAAARSRAAAPTAAVRRASAVTRAPSAGGLAAPVDARERHAPDSIVLAVVIALTGLGILMVYSSSCLLYTSRCV